MKPLIGNETCLLSYGDGISNVDIDQLIKFHKSHGKLVTVTAVHPDARFGEVELKGEQVTSFHEKPQTRQGWVNGGYFVIDKDTTSSRLVFNQIVALRDSWNKKINQ